MSAAEEDWLRALGERHFADLTPPEVTRALRALSSCYVERREKLARGGALDGAGKRAAFALFYGPQHFIVTREIWRALGSGNTRRVKNVVDLGCGTGSAGAAIALECGASIEGYDLNPWAVTEANWTYRTLGVRGRARVANIRSVRSAPSRATLFLAAYSVNELPDEARAALVMRFLDAHREGAQVLVIEPIGRRVNLWWTEWKEKLVHAGGREDEWRFRIPLPSRQRALAKAAGLNVEELTAKSLSLGL